VPIRRWYRAVDGLMRCNYSTPVDGAVQYEKENYEMFGLAAGTYVAKCESVFREKALVCLRKERCKVRYKGAQMMLD
jgi:hypothetical protein